MSMLLVGIFDGFLENIAKWNVITGLIVAVIALVLMITAKPIARKIFAAKTEDERTNLILILKVSAGVLAIVGCVLVMFI